MIRHTRPFNLKELKIEVTYRCDLNCVHCSSDARPSNPLEMSREDCLRVLSEAAAMGAHDVAFSGGEPLGWSHLPDAIKAATEAHLATTVYTSGNTADFDGKAKLLRSLGASRLVFSVFGGSATTHERITRVSSSFGRTKAALRAALAAGFTTELHFVPMSTNYRELKDVAAFAREVGASAISILRLVPQGRAALLHGRTLNRLQNLELRRQIQELRQAGYRVRVGSPYNFLMLSEKPGCWAAIDRLIVGPDLRIYPCDAFKRIHAAELVGTEEYSRLDNAQLSDCWQRSPYFEAIRGHLTTDFTDPCATCNGLEKCLSGCLAQKAIIHGALLKRPDPDCLASANRGKA